MKSFEFDTFKEYFEHHMRKQTQNQRGQKILTLAELAANLGYSSPSTLSMVASGERLPSSALLESLFEAWDIPALERDRIRLKVEIEKRNRQGKDQINLIQKYNKITPYHKIDLKKFNLIRDWYVLVIKLLVGLPNFNESPQWISQKLRKKITPTQAKKALDLLEETGLIERDLQSQLLKPTVNSTETTHDIVSEAIRENHKGMIDRALEALEEQNVEQRNFNSLSLSFNSEKMPLAKQRILEFIKNFNEEFSDESANQIYQMNVQFFEHTHKESQDEK